MKHPPIVPAEVDFTDPLAPSAPRFGDVYHARDGAFAQASHVFLAGNGLPGRWQGRDAFTILETGFGLGNNFLATWAAWRADPRRSRRLFFVSVEMHPLRADDLRRAHAASPEPALAAALCEAWPPLTPDLHLLAFDAGRVELLLALGDAATRLREIIAQADAFFLDGFAPARNPGMWDAGIFKALSRLSAPGATAATWSAARAVREGFRQAGFTSRRAPGTGGKRDITLADFAPRATAQRPVARTGPRDARRVAIVGGGLAGAACARALHAAGLQCIVLDRHPEPAAEASGNVAGLFHGVFHAEDGPHARAHRAAALLARATYLEAIAQGVPGAVEGLLRLEPDQADAAPLADALARSGLPPDFLQAWSPGQVRESGGPACAAWFYPGGGWISPRGLVRHWLDAPGIDWRGDAPVARLQRRRPRGGNAGSAGAAAGDAGGAGAWASAWQLFDDTGRLLAEADAVVLANADGTPAWWSHALDPVDGTAPEPTAALRRTRGQVTHVSSRVPALRPPRLPLAGAGYAIPLPDGDVLCGATTTLDDPDPRPRVADHVHNLRQLAALTGRPDDALATVDDACVAGWMACGLLQGRVGWRASTADRLPLVGAVPARWTGDAAHTPVQPRHWPRVPGLFVAAGFGSRGLTWAPLAGRLITAWLTGAPFPIDASLVDALDPAREPARRARHA